MKNLRWILIPICLSLSLSCGKKKEENDDGLTFTTSSKIVLLDADIYSCEDLSTGATTPSLKAISGKTSAIKIMWSGENSIEIQKATLKIKSNYLSGGEFTVDFVAEGMIYPGKDPEKVYKVDCGFRFGGLPLKDTTKSAFMTATITMIGTTTDADDNTSAVKAIYNVDLQYDP